MKQPVYTLWALWVVFLTASPGLFAEAKDSKQSHPPPAPKAGAGPPRPAAGKPPQPGGGPNASSAANGRPVYPLDRWAAMSPAQRDALMAKMTPERRENLQKRIAHWESMPEAQKERAREFAALPPDQKKIVRDHAEWIQQLPQERRMAVRKETNLLQQLSPEARQAEFDSPSFSRKFDDDEREHLKKIISTMPKD
jgi:hypothetical protein